MNVHKTYDRSDNDTYVEKLGTTPYQDVHLHMFRDPDGFITLDAIRGNFTADSLRDAENHVLRFPTSQDIGLEKVRDIKAITLYPMSLVERYDLPEEDLFYTQKLPVYIDQKTGHFVLFMDSRFLRDLNYIELIQHLEKGPFSQRIRQYPSFDIDTFYLGISFPEVSDIKAASDFFHDPNYKSPLRALYEAYVKYKLSCEWREKVIFVRYSNDPAVVSLTHLLGHECTGLTHQYRLEYCLGYKLRDRLHLADENGDICQDKVLKVDPSAPGFLVLPYSVDQMKILMRLDDSLDAYRLRVLDFLSQSKSPDGDLDCPLIDDEVLSDLIGSKS
jgi:hypothetical protein